MAVHQLNTRSRPRQPGRRIKLLLTSEEHAALDRLQKKHHLDGKDDAFSPSSGGYQPFAHGSGSLCHEYARACR
jgi:hypothetical protein